ncbi:MAG: hypothetical protein H6R01_859 [Burkholderiaceae bacterium]|nr:hypothetical protein [Burkholderiaceae bacterium]
MVGLDVHDVGIHNTVGERTIFENIVVQNTISDEACFLQHTHRTQIPREDHSLQSREREVGTCILNH